MCVYDRVRARAYECVLFIDECSVHVHKIQFEKAIYCCRQLLCYHAMYLLVLYRMTHI